MKPNKVVKNCLWRFAERCGAQGVSLIVTVILARLLDPEVYGVIALISVFVSLLGVVVDSGFGDALIQKKDADNLDFSTVFYFNILICLTSYAVIYFAATLIADFYHRAELTPMIRVMSLSLLISGVKNVQMAYVSRNLEFKRFFFATLGGTIAAAVVGIWMAYRGFGAWALIAQSLLNHTIDTAILWISVKWRPQLAFSFSRLKELFSFGWKMFVSALVNTAYGKINELIIGKIYSPSALAFYNRGTQFPAAIVGNLDTSIVSVLFPVLSSVQNDPNIIKAMTRRTLKVSTYLIMPMMFGLAACSEPLIRLLLTDKWILSVPYLRIFCVSYAFWPLLSDNMNAIRSLGYSNYYLAVDTTKKVISLIGLLISMWFGVIWMAHSFMFTTIISCSFAIIPNKKLLNYTCREQFADILPQIILTIIMGGIVYCVTFLRLSDWATLLIQVPLGVIIYILGSKLMKIDSFDYLWGIVKSAKHKNA